MNLKEEINELARKGAIFVGYNLKYGSQNYGLLKDVPNNQILEMPVAENLMTGITIGLSINKFKPVLVFERHDYMLNASDQLINHLSKINKMSEGQFNPCVIIRAIVGKTKPFYPDEVHVQNFTDIFTNHCSFPVKKYKPGMYLKAFNNNQSIIGIEKLK